MGEYKVISITDRGGKPRTDGRYPLRIGRICGKPYTRLGEPMEITWVSQSDGMPYVGEFRTSFVISVMEVNGTLTVTTRNSIYTFARV